MTVVLSQLLVCLGCPIVVFGQVPASSSVATQKSHVERFSTPEMRAEKVEAETTAKLTTNPKDSEALNLRALARMRFGRYQEAAEDLRRAVSLNPKIAVYQANLGFVLWKLNHFEESIAAERAAL